MFTKNLDSNLFGKKIGNIRKRNGIEFVTSHGKFQERKYKSSFRGLKKHETNSGW